jgi:hypothetical protein
VARVRQARRCHARRSDGSPCRAWAMAFQDVCRVHGGTAPRARKAAIDRRTEATLLRAFNADYERWLRDLAAWQAKRVMVTAELLGIDPADVQPVDIGCCIGIYGRPDSLDSKPAMRRDRRYLASKPDYVARTARWYEPLKART